MSLLIFSRSIISRSAIYFTCSEDTAEKATLLNNNNENIFNLMNLENFWNLIRDDE